MTALEPTVLRALARLLDYPTPQTIEALPLMDALFAGACTCAGATRPCVSLVPLFDELGRADLIDLQEAWIETFDRGRRTSLNLFEHVHGDSRDRGQAMVDLLAMYRQAGVELDGDQLPDYLPVFLEFVSLLPAQEAAERLADIGHIVRAIGETLQRRGSPYALVFDSLLAMLGEPSLAAGAQPQGAAAGVTPQAADDTTPEAIDEAWKDAPVNFLDAAAPCAPPPARGEQPIHIHRRAA